MRVRPLLLGAVLLLLLGPAVALSLTRLTDPTVGLGIQLQAFTAYGLPLYAAALVVVVGVALRRSWRRPVLLLPGALAVAGLVLHALWWAPLLTGAGRAPDPTAAPLVLMSSNLLFGRADGTEVVRAVVEHDVDVLVLNEVTSRTLAQMDGADLADVLPYRQGGAGDSNEGTMVLSRTPIELVEQVDGTTFDNLLVRTDGVTLLAAHPAAPLDATAWLGDHAVLAGVVEDRSPDVVVGDLNATLDHAPLRDLAARGYRDSVELLDEGLQRTWPAGGLYRPLWWAPPLVGIDHVLLAPTWTATSTGTVAIADTDHLAVVATLVPAAEAVSGGAP